MRSPVVANWDYYKKLLSHHQPNSCVVFCNTKEIAKMYEAFDQETAKCPCVTWRYGAKEHDKRDPSVANGSCQC